MSTLQPPDDQERSTLHPTSEPVDAGQNTPLGPDDITEDHEVEIRHKMPGVMRFSRRTMTAVYVFAGVLILAVLYAMGFFGGGKKVGQMATPPPVADVASPAPYSNPNAPDTNGFTPPSPPPSSSLPPDASQTTSPRAEDELSRALADASKTSTAAPLVPGTSSDTSSGSIPPPANLPSPGMVPEPGARPTVVPNQRQNATGSGQSFYVGGNNFGESNGLASGTGTPGTASQSGETSATNGSSPAASSPGTGNQAALQQSQRTAFNQNDQDTGYAGYLQTHSQPAPSRYELWAGSTIPAQLDTGINSDIPGPAVAHVVSDVFDSRSGAYLLIPRNARLVGHYNSSVSVGQARVQILWDRLIWPDGRQIALDGMPGADTEGNAGLYADVNDHRGRIITATIITGLLAGASQIAQGGQNSLVTINPYTGSSVALQPSTTSILASNLAQSAQTTGSQIIQQTTQQPPTLTVPKGERFSVILDRTVELEPYAADGAGR